jgi:hypothetical protein
MRSRLRYAQIANHESPRMTRLYDRTSDAISLDERACPAVPGIERILIFVPTGGLGGMDSA